MAGDRQQHFVAVIENRASRAVAVMYVPIQNATRAHSPWAFCALRDAIWPAKQKTRWEIRPSRMVSGGTAERKHWPDRPCDWPLPRRRTALAESAAISNPPAAKRSTLCAAQLSAARVGIDVESRRDSAGDNAASSSRVQAARYARPASAISPQFPFRLRSGVWFSGFSQAGHPAPELPPSRHSM